MRTPAAMIVGMVLAPCGLVLTLTATVAPNWRTLSSVPSKPSDFQYYQGIWDICQETTTNQNKLCGQTNDEYFRLEVVQVARGLMITSLIVTGIGIALASWGVRCWEDIPNFLAAAFGGLVIFISGILSLIPISWYNNKIYHLVSADITPASSPPTISVGYCLALGYIGSCMEIIAGFALMLCFVPPCKKCMKNKGKSKAPMYYSKKQTPNKNEKPSQVYSIQSRYSQEDHNPNDVGYSIQNDNYRHENGSRKPNSIISSPRSYTNPMDVTAGEYPRSNNRPGSQLSSLPCDSDLL
ncbi:PREDICTED: claudin-23 [Nanorana parkeri]|uniref:claudin-23 n=1 Tax=Nanorana parkeri TaxID=125878 RepID=UPI00085479E3|nr:PREDICTED: claudin-23 [Nanorana parkeri]